MDKAELSHHGILNQRWGKRNGPPYPLKGGDYSPSEKKAIKAKRKAGNSIYNKKHFDEVLKKDKTTLTTLSYDKDRTKDTDMFWININTMLFLINRHHNLSTTRMEMKSELEIL